MAIRHRWDIFCRVVDNLGDAGVCWRLARQLVAEHGYVVRLWIDDLEALRTLAPSLDTTQSQQTVDGVHIHHWTSHPVFGQAGEVVIEAFACELPHAYLQSMAIATPPPIWLNLEYLSAESWVEGCHTLKSPHPTLPLTKYFFFPGFTSATGGLLREQTLLEARNNFLTSAREPYSFWQRMEVPAPRPGQKQVSLFCYEHAPAQLLLNRWTEGAQEIRCLIPPGKPRLAVQSLLRGSSRRTLGKVELQTISFLSPSDYDRLLWSCDLNLVRGEDSFVRAQWAGKPMAWQIYPQAEEAHLDKLEAFMAIANFPEAQRRFLRAWNAAATDDVNPDDLAEWQIWGQDATQQAKRWAERLSEQTDLATNLVRFASDLL